MVHLFSEARFIGRFAWCLREAASSDTPDLDLPPLAELVRQKEKVCLNRIIATRLDAMDDERHSQDHLPPCHGAICGSDAEGARQRRVARPFLERIESGYSWLRCELPRGDGQACKLPVQTAFQK